jgi:hypothetical protein
MAGGNMSWHKMPGEKQEHYDMFMAWLGLPYEDPPKERTVREVYHRKTGATGNPSSHYFRVRDDNRWVQRATDYDAHRQAQIQEAEDEAHAGRCVLPTAWISKKIYFFYQTSP